MKKFSLFISAITIALSAIAQDISVPEPDFIHGYYHVTSESTFQSLPKEHGTFKKHESTFGKIGKIAEGAADIAGAAGGIAGATGNIGGAINGMRGAMGAASVASAASSINALAGYEGWDITFEGKNSTYSISAGEYINIIYREADNLTDPQELLRVVRLGNGKKDRKIRWKTMSYGLLGSKDATKNGYLPFEGKKYGESSYLITIPGSSLEKGEYAIITGSVEASTVIPVATFSIQ